MTHRTESPIILLACFFVFMLNAGLINTVYAAQNNANAALQNDPLNIYGKVTDVITTDSFTYIEVEAGKTKVWAAGPITPINKGDMIAFSRKTLMQNFHSKSLTRDFSVIYFVNNFITGKETSTTYSPHTESKKLQLSKSIIPTLTVTPDEVEVGNTLREATLDGLNGKSKTFSSYKGKPLIINIWASWCGPCRAEMGSLERLAQRYNKKELNIIGISTDDYRDKAQSFIKQTTITFDNFIDHNLLLENMLGAKSIPLTIFVDAEGRVLKKVRGSREWDNPEIIDAISKTFHIELTD